MYENKGYGPNFMGLFSLASTQGGYFRADQASEYGYSTERLSYYAKTGKFNRLRRGLYRLRDYPYSPNEEVVAAWVGIGRDDAFVSHLTALTWHGLSDLFREKIDITVPRSARYLKTPPEIALHTTDRHPGATDVNQSGPIRVSSPLRALIESAEIHVAPDQLEKAVIEVMDRGMVGDRKLRAAIEELRPTPRKALGNAFDAYREARTYTPATVRYDDV